MGPILPSSTAGPLDILGMAEDRESSVIAMRQHGCALHADMGGTSPWISVHV